MKILTQQQVDQYAEEGATHPIRVFSAGRAAHYLAELEKGEISYVPTSVRCTGSVRHTSMLMRGVDRLNYFDHEPRVR